MNIQTFSIVAGIAACDARCPYCVSKMTGIKNLGFKELKINWRNFNKACRLAQISRVPTVLITSKGEPLLYPEQLTDYLIHLKKYNFPFIELQTNGLLLDYKFARYQKYLKEWYRLGLGLIAISIVHDDSLKNKAIYTPNKDYINLERLIKRLHYLGFSVRLSCTLLKGYIDSPQKVQKMAKFAQKLGIEQLSLRPVTRPLVSEDLKVYQWVGKHMLENYQIERIGKFLDKKGNRLVTFGHGSVLYDLGGQNVCLTNALTIKPETSDIRQLIFFPDGHLRFDWQFKGAILL